MTSLSYYLFLNANPSLVLCLFHDQQKRARRSSTSFPSYSLTKTSPVDNTGFTGARGIISFRERHFHTSRGKAVNTGKNNIIYHRNHCLTVVILGLIFVFFFIRLYMLGFFFLPIMDALFLKAEKKKKP